MTARLNKNVREHFRRDGKPKRDYSNKAAAQAAAVKRRMTAYRCNFCGGWHLAR